MSPELSARAGAREALLASAGLLLLLAVGKSFGGLVPFGNDLVFTVAAGFQLYVPLWLIQRAGELPESHRIHVHGLLLGPVAALRRRRVLAARQRRQRGRPDSLGRTLAFYGRGAIFRPRALAKDLGLALTFALVTFVPFGLGHYALQSVVRGRQLDYAVTIPDDIVETLLKNTFLVGLPEELFYRGFLETRLERLWPTRWAPLLIPISRTVILASFLFALGHFVGEWNPARLGPFFPAFLFSACARTSGSIAGAVVLHGLSNAFSAILMAGY